MQPLVVAEGTENHLAWEARRRVPAATAAILAGLFIFGGSLLRFLLLSDPPHVGVLESLDRLAAPGPIGAEESLRVEAYRFYDERATGILAGAVVSGLGFVFLAAALTYLGLATRSRRPEMPAIALYLAAIGGLTQFLSTSLATLSTNQAIGDFLAGRRTIDAAEEVGAGGLAAVAQVLSIGTLALAIGIVLIAINAMRVGLLTKFVGIIGIFAGALLILPLNPLPVILAFWLLLLGVLFLQRWPSGQPPAWRTGRAEPWPSSAELRRNRQAAMAARRGRGTATTEPEPEPEPVAATAAGAATGTPRRRKRKKRS